MLVRLDEDFPYITIIRPSYFLRVAALVWKWRIVVAERSASTKICYKSFQNLNMSILTHIPVANNGNYQSRFQAVLWVLSDQAVPNSDNPQTAKNKWTKFAIKILKAGAQKTPKFLGRVSKPADVLRWETSNQSYQKRKITQVEIMLWSKCRWQTVREPAVIPH